MFNLDFKKAEELDTKMPNICCIIKKAREFQENIYFCFIEYAKDFACVDHSKLENYDTTLMAKVKKS